MEKLVVLVAYIRKKGISQDKNLCPNSRTLDKKNKINNQAGE
jgi:hypothetical protein